MTDPFALLDEPRRPWLDPARLKAKFLSLSALVHPDRTHGATEQEKAVANQRFTELNAAYLRLRELKSRLQVLIELERGTAPSSVQPVGSKYVSLFTQISDLCRKTDTFL